MVNLVVKNLLELYQNFILSIKTKLFLINYHQIIRKKNNFF